MLTAVGAQAGVVRGLPCLLGVTTGMAAMIFVVPLGLGSLVLGHPFVLKALHWGGAAVLLWLSCAEAGSPVIQAGSLAGPFVVAALPTCFLWLAFGAAVQHVLHSRRRRRIFNIAMGALLALSVTLIVR